MNGESRHGKSPLEGRLFVVMGAGGAGKSLAYGAAQKGAKVVVANRTFGKEKKIIPAQATLEYYLLKKD